MDNLDALICAAVAGVENDQNAVAQIANSLERSAAALRAKHKIKPDPNPTADKLAEYMADLDVAVLMIATRFGGATAAKILRTIAMEIEKMSPLAALAAPSTATSQ